MPYLVRTRFGEKVKTTVSILKQNYERLRSLADLRFGGNLSLALDYVLDWFFRIMGTTPELLGSNTQIIIMSGNDKRSVTSVTKRDNERSMDARSSHEKVDALEVELLSADVEARLNMYLETLNGFASQLNEFLKMRRVGLSVAYPNIADIQKQVSKIAKDVSKILNDRKTPKTPIVLELIDKVHQKIKEVKELVAEVLKR